MMQGKVIATLRAVGKVLLYGLAVAWDSRPWRSSSRSTPVA